jgi:hypothetical protein
LRPLPIYSVTLYGRELLDTEAHQRLFCQARKDGLALDHRTENESTRNLDSSLLVRFSPLSIRIALSLAKRWRRLVRSSGIFSEKGGGRARWILQ